MFVLEKLKRKRFSSKKNEKTNVVKDEEIFLKEFKEEISEEIGINLIDKNNKREDD